MNEVIEEKLQLLPERPGVYLMKDKAGVIIYVGKAVILKNRVRQYFQNNHQHAPKVRAMVERIDDFEIIITGSEVEALILECNLIKKYRPKYNISLKDDKMYPYLKVTVQEKYPRVFITRKVLEDGARYFGPYTDATALHRCLRLLKKMFHFRICRHLKEGQSCFGYPIVPAGVLYHPARDLILKTERDISPEALRKAMDRELRRDGMVLGDPEVLRAMEHSALEAPCFLPIQVSKDGGISGGVATAAQLGRLGQYVEKLLHQITRELRQGNIDADPCWRGPQESACTYCDFASACHFQDGQAGDRLRPLKRVKADEFWEFVAHETGEEGRHGEF